MINWAKNTYNHFDTNYSSHMRVVRYIISGGTAAVVDLGSLSMLTEKLRIWYVYSTPLAFVIAFLVSFSLQKYWTFRDHGHEEIGRQGSLYFAVSVANLLVNWLMVVVLTKFAHMHYIISQIIAAGILALTSFFIYKRFIFRVENRTI